MPSQGKLPQVRKGAATILTTAATQGGTDTTQGKVNILCVA